ncbi:MAG TPA: DUF433 domain-containing protein [Terracidiphilus sp.]|nr:DUF433 domain-containing protein [Terracidiphilus sp.]
MDWSTYSDVEIVAGKVSGVPVLKGTRLPVTAITGNYDAFLEAGSSPDEALTETAECYPEIGTERIKAILDWRAAHDLQPQP